MQSLLLLQQQQHQQKVWRGKKIVRVVVHGHLVAQTIRHLKCPCQSSIWSSHTCTFSCVVFILLLLLTLLVHGKDLSKEVLKVGTKVDNPCS